MESLGSYEIQPKKDTGRKKLTKATRRVYSKSYMIGRLWKRGSDQQVS